jgi:5-methyltetrahydropteroyltriglutamate--homocysteine methyltransferase
MVHAARTILPTTVMGSHPQPDWLIDRERLRGRFPPRVRAKELWRIDERYLEEAQDDATLLAIQDMERAGIDRISDGEIRRESYSNRFATALDGVDVDNPGTALDRSGKPNPVPRVIGPISRRHPVNVRDVEFLRANTDREIIVTVPGPFTMTQQAQDDYYGDPRTLGLAYAEAVNEELHDLQKAGADALQIDEPYLQPRAEQAASYAIQVINRALRGLEVRTVLHTCFGYARVKKVKPNTYPFLRELNECDADELALETAQPKLDLTGFADIKEKTIVMGVLDLDDLEVESPGVVADRLRAALEYVPIERLKAAPDCGMKYLPRDVAVGKLHALAQGAGTVRREHGFE